MIQGPERERHNRVSMDQRATPAGHMDRTAEGFHHANESEHRNVLARYANEIRTENGLPQSLFDQIEDLIRDYCFYEASTSDKQKGGYRPPIRHGENVFIGTNKSPISWHFNSDFREPSEHVTVSYKQGPEWVDDCYLDEVPVEFLLFILKAIKDRGPLKDIRPVTVEAATEAYMLAVEADEAERELRKNLAGLHVIPRWRGL